MPRLLVWSYAENRGICTHLDDLRVCCGDFVNRKSCHIFQVLIHGRHDVTQLIQFQNGIMEGVKVKMRGQNFGLRIVCRVLYRCKGIDLFT